MLDAPPPSVLDLAIKLSERLKASGETLALAESCTGGLVAGVLTSIPGASSWLVESIVVYTAESKMNRLGVPRDLIEREGTVSANVAKSLCLGLASTSSATLCAAVVGWAGPDTGNPKEPAGFVIVSVLHSPSGRHKTLEYRHAGDREEVRWAATEDLLALMQEFL